MISGITLMLVVFIAFIVLDLAALRFGADSRDGRRNWW